MKKGISLKVAFLLLFILGFYQLPAQDTDIYSLLTEKYVDRPVNVHRGQLQVNTGYELSVLNRKFDSEGKAVNLAKDGSAAMQNLFPIDIRYGILEHLQLSIGINYARTGIRERNIWIIGYDTDVSINELNEYKGFDNLNLGLSFQAPFGLKHISWTLNGRYLNPCFLIIHQINLVILFIMKNWEPHLLRLITITEINLVRGFQLEFLALV